MKNITVESLSTQLARGVLRAPDINPKTRNLSTYEIVFTLRPSWSTRKRYERALPGGGIKKKDFIGILDLDDLKDPHYVLTLDQLIQAGLKAVEREILEELGITLAPGLLGFVDTSTVVDRSQGEVKEWTSYSFVANLPTKPTLLVKPESAGTTWIDENAILNGRPRMLSGHLGIARRALRQIKK